MQVHRRLITTAAVAVASLTVAVPATQAAGSHGHHHQAKRKAPKAIALPDGFGPESLTGSGNTLYSGSSTTGAVWTANTKTGKSRVLVPAQTGRSAFGTAVAGKNLLVAGGATGNLYVYDRTTGADVSTIAVGGKLLNDVVVRGNIAYVTDTLAPVIYQVALDGSAPPKAINLTNYPFTEGQPTADGIAWAGNALLVGDITSAALYRIDPATGAATKIDVGSATFPMNDGVLLIGRTFYVAEGDGRLAVVKLSGGSDTGSLVSQRTYAAALTDVARAGGSLWIMDAKFQQTVDPTSKAVARRIS
jgi:streptogramin lyase